jgi:hypothetical protein
VERNSTLSPFALPAIGRRPRLCYRAARDAWSLLWPCRKCGGAELPLILRSGADGPEDLEDEVGDRGCPGCETRQLRAATPGEPAVWYDAILTSWVVRVQSPDGRTSAILPLDIPWFDAPYAVVHQAAADLLFAGEVLCADEEPDDQPIP